MTNTAIRYTPEFKQTLIDLHEKGHSFKELHEEYGPSLDTIRKWVQAAVQATSKRKSPFEGRTRYFKTSGGVAGKALDILLLG
ncbi:Transposase [Lacticaseibacillus paracasei]|uniref:transposase n=1 Tax=Lacticaseibacillus paracasei TaxID=1597 RepID=UPI000FF062A4|nr:transposase [Lacticaseibacillus paracasei]RNE24469.1 Transposase [Lacticaseibacillus paracasei]RNE41925.1 Transposase [Lacticaseibacillus paracasei]